MTRIFEAKDKTKRTIYLTQERWQHITKHPEMHNKEILERITLTLETPTRVLQSSDDKKVHVYFRYYKERKEYLPVSVKYLNGEGYIITSFYTDKAKL